MREFKFRIWAKEAKKWIAPEMFAVYEKGIYPFGISPESVELQQFTSLKDINGKEIYEGDILLTLHGSYFVEWDDIWYSLKEKNGKRHSLLNIPIAQHAEIIGNIFENSNLIK
jgi:hypothetical protein